MRQCLCFILVKQIYTLTQFKIYLKSSSLTLLPNLYPSNIFLQEEPFKNLSVYLGLFETVLLLVVNKYLWLMISFHRVKDISRSKFVLNKAKILKYKSVRILEIIWEGSMFIYCSWNYKLLIFLKDN